MKKIVSILCVVILVLSSVSVGAVTMYAPDGRTASVSSKDVNAWKSVGWYTKPVMTVYAPDGRTCVIAKDDYQAWKNVGWHSKPVMYVYAPDGRKTVIAVSDFAAWYNTGWSHTRSHRSIATVLAYRDHLSKKRVIAWEGSKGVTNKGTTLLNRISPNVDTWSNVDKKNFLAEGSYIEYDLGRRYSIFTGTYGIRKDPGNIEGSMRMQVYSDDKLIYKSDVINYKSDPINFGIRVDGCKTLKIKFVPVSGGEPLAYDAYAFSLGNAVIYK